MSVLPPGAEMCVTGRFAPQAADEKGQDGFDAMVFGSL